MQRGPFSSDSTVRDMDEKNENCSDGADGEVDVKALNNVKSANAGLEVRGNLHHRQVVYSVNAPPTRGPMIKPS